MVDKKCSIHGDENNDPECNECWRVIMGIIDKHNASFIKDGDFVNEGGNKNE